MLQKEYIIHGMYKSNITVVNRGSNLPKVKAIQISYCIVIAHQVQIKEQVHAYLRK